MATTDETTASVPAAYQPEMVISKFSTWTANVSEILKMPSKVMLPFFICILGGTLILFSCMTEGTTALVLLTAAIILSIGSLIITIIGEIVAESSQNRPLSREQ